MKININLKNGIGMNIFITVLLIIEAVIIMDILI